MGKFIGLVVEIKLMGLDVGRNNRNDADKWWCAEGTRV